MSRADGFWPAVTRRLLVSIRSGAALQDTALAILFFVSGAMGAVGQPSLLDSPLHFFLSIAAALSATSVAALTLLVVRAAWRRVATSYAVPVMFLVFAAMGALRLESLAAINAMVGLDTFHEGWARVVAGSLQGITWVIAASLYYANRDRFLQVRGEVLEEQARIEMGARQQSALADVLSEGLADAVAKRVEQSVSHTRSLIVDALPLEDSREALRGIAQALRRAIDEDIRPMSRQLWEVPPAEQMRVTLAQILRLGCYTRPFPLATGAGVVALVVGPMALSMTQPLQALGLLAVQTLLVGLALGIYDSRIRRRGEEHAFDFWVGVFVATVVVAVPPAVAPLLGWSFEEARYWAVFCSFGMVLLLVFLSVVLGLAGTWAEVGARASASLSRADVERQVHARELLETSRALARHLHSSLQGRLMAISLELERAADAGRSDLAPDALRRLDGLLQSPLVGAFEPSVPDVGAALQDLADEWAAIADVNMSVDLGDPAHLRNPGLILGIAEEAIGNAVRHAHATSVDIRVWREGHDVVVRAVNDGGAPRLDGSAGLGSRWLDSISPDSWTLSALPDGGGTELLVRLRDLLDPEDSA